MLCLGIGELETDSLWNFWFREHYINWAVYLLSTFFSIIKFRDDEMNAFLHDHCNREDIWRPLVNNTQTQKRQIQWLPKVCQRVGLFYLFLQSAWPLNPRTCLRLLQWAHGGKVNNDTNVIFIRFLKTWKVEYWEKKVGTEHWASFCQTD